jgi:hypothetical protein
MAVQQGQRWDTVEVTLVVDESATAAVVRWTLRDFSRLHVVESWPADVTGIVVATPDAAPAQADAGAWRGMRFVATVRGADEIPKCQGFSPPTCNELAQWYLYRTSNVPLTFGDVILWRLP